MAFLPVSVNETTGGKYTEIAIMESGCLGMIVISICYLCFYRGRCILHLKKKVKCDYLKR